MKFAYHFLCSLAVPFFQFRRVSTQTQAALSPVVAQVRKQAEHTDHNCLRELRFSAQACTYAYGAHVKALSTRSKTFLLLLHTRELFISVYVHALTKLPIKGSLPGFYHQYSTPFDLYINSISFIPTACTYSSIGTHTRLRDSSTPVQRHLFHADRRKCRQHVEIVPVCRADRRLNSTLGCAFYVPFRE